MIQLEWELNLYERGSDIGIWEDSKLTFTCHGNDSQVSEIRETINNKILQMHLQEVHQKGAL